MRSRNFRTSALSGASELPAACAETALGNANSKNKQAKYADFFIQVFLTSVPFMIHVRLLTILIEWDISRSTDPRSPVATFLPGFAQSGRGSKGYRWIFSSRRTWSKLNVSTKMPFILSPSGIAGVRIRSSQAWRSASLPSRSQTSSPRAAFSNCLGKWALALVDVDFHTPKVD